ncbi:ATP-binding protein [Streptomyces sp. NPDC048305]|uniref:ATP-binding protein n=1 Tax=Streptomyces sp. NPDC048305 TaxID=3365532 RepID=UPI0037114465
MPSAQELPTPGPAPEEHALHGDRLDYTPTARSISLARHRTARLVRGWGSPDLADDAALLVSELATNALLHGGVKGRLIRVELSLSRTTLRIAVSDPRGERLPGLRLAGEDECYGRGLMIVAGLADRWGVAPRTVGKTVYAELAARRAPDAPVGPRALRAGPPGERPVRPR